MQTKNQTHKDAVLVITREFNAPIQTVFAALSHPEALAEWWGPVGYKMTVTKFSFKPDGLCLFKMENETSLMWAKFIYGPIKSPESVEFTLSFSNETGGLTRAPFFENWPLEIRNIITLTEQNGKTTLTNNCFPVNATQEELTSFSENKSSFNHGLSASMDKLRKHLSKSKLL